jgi:PIN domain nuclease of toxin-antitoxin system
VIHLDTHVVLWLAQRAESKLGANARRAIARHGRAVSPVVLLELELMHEIGRLKASPDEVLSAIRSRMTLAISPTPLTEIVERARILSWTRDPFDRLIVANAIADEAALVTSDGRILDHFKDAVW